MSYMIQNKKPKQTFENAQYGLEIIFKASDLKITSFISLSMWVSENSELICRPMSRQSHLSTVLTNIDKWQTVQMIVCNSFTSHQFLPLFHFVALINSTSFIQAGLIMASYF